MIGFGEAVSNFYRGYFDFSGRATRAEYWWPVLMQIIVYVALVAAYFLTVDMDAIQGPGDVPAIPMGVVLGGVLFLIINIIPSYSVAARRFHDLNQTGWLVLVFVVVNAFTFISAFAQLIWFAFPGTDGPNQYGPDPYGYDEDIFG